MSPPSDLPAPKPDHSFTRPPKSQVGRFLWRKRMWFESTFVLSMLEPWEKILLITIFFGIFILVLTGLFRYMPRHLVEMQRRAVYYLWGQEGDVRGVRQWIWGVGVEGVGSVPHKDCDDAIGCCGIWLLHT